jgi:hypothetical protein
MYSFLHNKSCNCLRVDKAVALVYIYTNSKLLSQRPSVESIRWYENNIFFEDLDPNDDGQEAKSEENDEGSDDDDGNIFADEGSDDDDGNIFADKAQMEGANGAWGQ